MDSKKTKSSKKPTKSINPEKKVIKEIPQAEWLLIVGGSELQRKEKAGKLVY